MPPLLVERCLLIAAGCFLAFAPVRHPLRGWGHLRGASSGTTTPPVFFTLFWCPILLPRAHPRQRRRPNPRRRTLPCALWRLRARLRRGNLLLTSLLAILLSLPLTRPTPWEPTEAAELRGVSLFRRRKGSSPPWQPRARPDEAVAAPCPCRWLAVRSLHSTLRLAGLTLLLLLTGSPPWPAGLFGGLILLLELILLSALRLSFLPLLRLLPTLNRLVRLAMLLTLGMAIA